VAPYYLIFERRRMMVFYCKCTVVPIKVGIKNENDAYVIHPCPVHKAAPDMMAALEQVKRDVEFESLGLLDLKEQIEQALPCRNGTTHLKV
jgi:hypothetical protein